jgi:hypothetical protein
MHANLGGSNRLIDRHQCVDAPFSANFIDPASDAVISALK